MCSLVAARLFNEASRANALDLPMRFLTAARQRQPLLQSEVMHAQHACIMDTT
jgi:hypothetical protein